MTPFRVDVFDIPGRYFNRNAYRSKFDTDGEESFLLRHINVFRIILQIIAERKRYKHVAVSIFQLDLMVAERFDDTAFAIHAEKCHIGCLISLCSRIEV